MQALLMILLAQWLIATGSLLIKLLDPNTGVFQLVLYRQLFATLLVLPFVWRLQGGLRISPLYRVHMVRALLIGLGNGLFFIAIMNLPLASVTAVLYLSPLMLLVMSAAFLKETIGYRHSVAGIIGFCGILMISQPSSLNPYLLLAVLGALISASNNLILKRYSAAEHPFSTLFWSNAFAMVFLIPAAVFEGASLVWDASIVGMLLALFYLGMTYLVIHAYRRADASQLAPAEYTGLVFATLLGLWFLGEVPNWLSLIGIALVMCSAVLPVYPELKGLWRQRVSRAPRAPD
ncbi:integral membrane domain protein [Shewanella amazonensis SB2B]|uniref:Integral membrane domain protein n=1 Tax=Shewanella amazonensis (strain ATCC BAA-1098 / SB2B) TaxID=326297 RepID=A1S4I4_SHEAM|nr:DMT family transporter [Shewanella amazonensis]ABL99290.1 integral membrane domain protein [Shewanella amazonensis SB2B]